MSKAESDASGTWLVAAGGHRMIKPGSVVDLTYSRILYVPDDEPFTVIFNSPRAAGRRAPSAVYIDITTRLAWAGDEVAMIDLDLDVVQDWSGKITLEDQDEFEAHRHALDYPADIVGLARAGAERAAGLLTSRSAPFDRDTSSWLRALDAEAGIRARDPD